MLSTNFPQPDTPYDGSKPGLELQSPTPKTLNEYEIASHISVLTSSVVPDNLIDLKECDSVKSYKEW